MQIFKEIKPLKAFLRGQRVAGKSIGLVPTMGALHGGHLSLLQAAFTETNLTVCSIFVNPTQFNNPDDLAGYPRSLDRDLELLRQHGCNVAFCPDDDEMYDGAHSTSFDFGRLDKVLEGKYRPGHFSGVALAVSKLFNIITPDIAYFGQKDFQQFLIIDRLCHDLKFDVQLRCIPICREHDGLAMSSRNLRLTAGQRKEAGVLFKSLQLAGKLLREGKTLPEVHNLVRELFAAHRQVRLEYFQLADSENLKEINDVTQASRPILLVAAYVGEVRLIDNLLLIRDEN